MQKKFIRSFTTSVKIAVVIARCYISDLSYMFLVGGFAESPILQQEIRREFSHILKILIPAGVSLAILKGKICPHPGPEYLH